MVLCACAGGPADPGEQDGSIHIKGLVFENHSTGYVTAVRLLVPATGGFVSCGNVAPEGLCSTTFPERTWQGNEFEVTWSQAGNIWSTGLLDVEPPADWAGEVVARVRVVIAGPGVAGAELIEAD